MPKPELTVTIAIRAELKIKSSDEFSDTLNAVEEFMDTMRETGAASGTFHVRGDEPLVL